MGRKAFKERGFSAACMMLFVLFSFVAQAILPAGFMPSVGKDGYTEIVICSGMDMKTILVPDNGAAPTGHEEENPVCAYQTLASQKILITPPALAAPVAATLEIAAPRFSAQDPETSPVYSFAARGPPSV